MSGGSDEDFQRFVAARSATLLRTAYLLTGDIWHAEDLLQIALLKTYRHWNRLENTTSPDAFVRKVMANSRASWWRRRRVAKDSVETVPEAAVSDDSGSTVDRDEMWRALAQLPFRMRAVLVLRYWEDLSEAETARVLDCAPGTVKSQASRGLARLRAQLGDSREGIARLVNEDCA